ncbi:MAG: Fe-S protein assembly co-chaperone HscB [Alphaproteobacteria bacterium]|jgi:Fe-S protein assembly co-chaperone HscB|nr:Fe-S protein assembly co-chaperone HscB [Alphaproteobacteria bacterium]
MKLICVNCSKETNTFICSNCGYLNPLQEIDFFSYLGISQNLNVDLNELEANFLSLMSQYHPDNFVSKSKAEQHNATVHSSYLNKAYETLFDATKRFAYMYFLINGEEITEEIDSKNGSLFTEFLEYYEELENIQHTNNLKIFQEKLHSMKQDVLDENSDIDFKNKSVAYHVYVRLKYIDKIIESSKKLEM